MPEIVEEIRRALGEDKVAAGAAVHVDYTHDEALTAQPVVPLAVIFPASTDDVVAVMRLAHEHSTPVVVRGSGTGLSGGCRPEPDGIVLAFDKMRSIRTIDTDNSVAVVEPGVTLAELNTALEPLGLIYPVSPGETSASLGGNVATNAGGMRAIRYGVTRHHVLGLEVVLANGTVLRTGGKFVKSSSGYDLTQLLIGSEGTLAVTTEVTVKIEPRLGAAATVLAPFASLDEVAHAVAPIVASGVVPSILEYIDTLAMAGIVANAELDLGVPDAIKAETLAYLVVVIEGTDPGRVDEDTEALATLLERLGALDVYVLPAAAGAQLIAARENAFFAAKASGADDIIDAVVPRAAIPDYLAIVAKLAADYGALVTGCGHVGDGNVHLSVFQPDADQRHALIRDIFTAALDAGGAISGEHGIGTEKQEYYLDTLDPTALSLMRSIKSAFDPSGILGPNHVFTSEGDDQ